MKKTLYLLCFLSLCWIPCFSHAQDSVSTGVKVLTDREREIVFEELLDEQGQVLEEEIILSVNKEGTQIFSFEEPGTYKYQVYEKKDAPNRETKEYILTACVFSDENTGKLNKPNVIVDNADGSGKPNELYFGEESEEDIPDIEKTETAEK